MRHGVFAWAILSWLAVALPAGANAGSESIPWLSAPGYEAAITLLGAAGAASPDSGGLVFTSRDYQKLLLVPESGETAFVFDLQQREVASIPRSSVQIGEEGGASVRASASPSPLGQYLVNEADIRFQNEFVRIHLGPKPDLVGEVSLEEILARKPGFRSMAAKYRPDSTAIAAIRALAKPVDILVFFGTWCPVCAQRVPLFLKIVEEASNPRIRVRFIATDADHKQPADLLKTYDVHITPMFVALMNGVEIGRIDRKPRISLERDLAEILKRAG
jgi:thiol-disulfide isomerase/thioredoxin